MRRGWKRADRGLYICPREQYVITRDVEATGSYRALYTIRIFEGWGHLLDGVTLYPDYGWQIFGEEHSLADAKAAVERLHQYDDSRKEEVR